MTQIEALEKQKQDAQHQVEKRDAAYRLEQNADFRKLILDEFCIQETARLIGLTMDANISQEHRELSQTMATAGPQLKSFLRMVEHFGNKAENSMDELDQAILEVRAEA